MSLKGLPVPLILDLWSLGHSASDVAARVGCHRKQVTAIVAMARKIRDPRAVLHTYEKKGRLIGRMGRNGEHGTVDNSVPLIRGIDRT